MNNDNAAPQELSMEDLDAVAGGKFSWKGFVGAVLGGGATGGMGGAAVGGIGAAPGALGGALLGGFGYCLTSLF
jgi:hypothetical protein